jgi:glycosyltransferase involved in cell wall biosynthesis
LVSIVTPSYNHARFLEATLRSVLAQTYPRIEYLVMDGGSTDGSVEIIRRHEARLTYWQSRRDDGFADAIAQGFERSRGEILAYLNSDDLLDPEATARAVAFLIAHPEVDLVYGNRVCIDEAGRLLYYRPNLPWFTRTPYIAMTIGQESCFWRRKSYEAVGGIDRRLRFAIDYDLFSKIARRGRVAHCGWIWGYFRKHATSKTMTQYQSLGKQEGAHIQETVWGGRPPRWAWLTVLFLMRGYALLTMGMVRRPPWPDFLDPEPPPGLVRRYFESLHETSPVKRLWRRLVPGGAEADAGARVNSRNGDARP